MIEIILFEFDVSYFSTQIKIFFLLLSLSGKDVFWSIFLLIVTKASIVLYETMLFLFIPF